VPTSSAAPARHPVIGTLIVEDDFRVARRRTDHAVLGERAAGQSAVSEFSTPMGQIFVTRRL
jgi:hypothetical protein